MRMNYKVWEEGKGPDFVLEVARLATPVRAPQKLWKASTRLATPVRAPQGLSKASTRLEPSSSSTETVEG